MPMSRLAATDKTKAVKSDDFVWHVTQAPRARKNPRKPALEAARRAFCHHWKTSGNSHLPPHGIVVKPFGTRELSAIGPASDKPMVRTGDKCI
jgi:hypothetical protein